jgi:SAM-dependent methyltransferase
VDADLLNEHMARYAFAVRLARGKRVLDAGCGAGYGAAELAHAGAWVVGADVAAEAVDFARANYQRPNLLFERASCTALPHPNAAFDLVVAFELIEHVEDWRAFLLEARRVLSPTGQFIVSTPNKLYYTESRGSDGPNPFHVHEFTFEEFRSELKSVFPSVSMFLENHVEGVSFQPFEQGNTVEARVETGEPAPDEAHFFVAVCAHKQQLGNPTFVYLPRAANVLRERERHIGLLERELELKNQWLEQARSDVERTQTDLELSNRWAESVNRDLDAAREVVGGLQEENRLITAKAAGLAAERDSQTAELACAVEALHRTERDLEERTAWALRLQEEAQELEASLAAYRASRWVRLGRKVGLGPAL